MAGIVWWNEGVEYGNLRYARKHVLDREDPSRLAGLCSGAIWKSERIFSLTWSGYQTACGEELSAVSDAVADRLHLVERTDYTVPGLVSASSTRRIPVVWSGMG